jgi:hypothetical protein
VQLVLSTHRRNMQHFRYTRLYTLAAASDCSWSKVSYRGIEQITAALTCHAVTGTQPLCLRCCVRDEAHFNGQLYQLYTL